jgi:hypothetical protein
MSHLGNQIHQYYLSTRIIYAVFPSGPPQQPAEQALKMQRMALRLMMPSLAECVQQWEQECLQELGTTDLNKVCTELHSAVVTFPYFASLDLKLVASCQCLARTCQSLDMQMTSFSR